uniref:CCHC-type domain-containing protein n=1 Tax=Lepisosteus oculatus TaxID=7918 RepID=W5NLC3_LEPOC
VTVHMFNPHVPEADISIFLKRFLDIQGEGKKVLDEEGIWNFKRRYMARFRPSKTSLGGVLHPPATFYIGPNRGYLVYSGQPKTCRKCGQEGHLVVDCVEQLCRRCGQIGHSAVSCREDMVCNLCGGQGHAYRACPRKIKTFASVVA